jgi:predicted Zn-dependent protease
VAYRTLQVVYRTLPVLYRTLPVAYRTLQVAYITGSSLSTVNHEVRILHPNHYDQGPKVMYKETQQYKSMVVLSMLSDMEHKTNKKKFLRYPLHGDALNISAEVSHGNLH